MTQVTPHPSALTFGAAAWPSRGPVYVQLNKTGGAMGWSSRPYDGKVAGPIRAQAAAARAKWAALAVGDQVVAPVRWHPRHGVTSEVWLRVK